MAGAPSWGEPKTRMIAFIVGGAAIFVFAMWATTWVGGSLTTTSSTAAGGIRAGGGLGTDAQYETGDSVSTETFPTFDDDTTTVAEISTRPLVVNFFAASCVPCVSEMPAFEEVHQKMNDQVDFLGLSVRESLESGREIAERTGVSYALGRDTDGSLLADFGGIVMPTTALVDEQNRIVMVHNGELSAIELEQLIMENLLR